MIQLQSVYRVRDASNILYELLLERTPEQSISHRAMPSLEEHVAFIRSIPYIAWYLIQNEAGEYVGATYLSREREIGVFVFTRHHGRGYGAAAVRDLMAKWPGRFLANINPANASSIRFFQKLGARHIQSTYEL